MSVVTCRLPSRSLLRLTGTDVHEFLQGLITQDMRKLQPGGATWGCFLYFTGRVMCDAYVYQSKHTHQEQSAVLIDVHRDGAEALLDHLVEMRMRRKIKIESVSNELAVVASARYVKPQPVTSSSSGSTAEPDVPQGTAADARATLSVRNSEVFTDPRSRFLTLPAAMRTSLEKTPRDVAGASLDTESSHTSSTTTIAADCLEGAIQLERTITPHAWAPAMRPTDLYDELLMANGIGEGPAVFRDGKSLPFEANTDFLEGVDFHKGCYVGQELTHRTHVMLVTRKRTLPLFFDDPGCAPKPGDGLFLKGGKEKVGEVLTASGQFGLGLLRLRYMSKETLTFPGLTLQAGAPVKATVPAWWPLKPLKKVLKNNA